MHLNEEQLALYASGDTTFVQTLRLRRHLGTCTECANIVQEYRDLTKALAAEPEIPDWSSLAAEMKANINVGLEAGACLPSRNRAGTTSHGFWNPRLTVAFASLAILAFAGIALRPKPVAPVSTVLAGQQSVHVDTEGVTITNVLFE